MDQSTATRRHNPVQRVSWVLLALALVAAFWIWRDTVARSAGSSSTNNPQNGRGALSSSKTTITKSLLTSAPLGGRLAARSLRIVARTSDPLAHALAQHTARALAENFESVESASSTDGSAPEHGTRAPDLFLTLASVDQSTSSGGHSVYATLGTQLGRSHATQFIHDGFLPQIETHARFEIYTSSTGTSADQLASEIAPSLVKNVRETVSGIHAQHGGGEPFPELPNVFYPEFQPVDPSTLPLDTLDDLTLLASWSRPLHHNETWWQASASGTPGEVFDRITQAAKTLGFEVSNSFENNDRQLKRGNDRLRIYHDNAFDPDPSGAKERANVLVRYRKRASTEARTAAIETTLADDAPIELMTLFSRNWSTSQQARVLKRLASADQSPGQQPSALLAIIHAELLKDSGAEYATQARVATWLARTTFGGDALEDRASSLANGLDADNVRPQELLAAGFRQLTTDTPESSPLECAVERGSPVRAFVTDTVGTKVQSVLVAGFRSSATDASHDLVTLRVLSGSLKTEQTSSGLPRFTDSIDNSRNLEAKFFRVSSEDATLRVRLTLTR